MGKKICPDVQTIRRLKNDFFISYATIAKWMGVSREYVRQLAGKEAPKKQASWESVYLTNTEANMALKAAETDGNLLTDQGNVVLLYNGISRAIVFIREDEIKCVFRLSSNLLQCLEERSPSPNRSGKVFQKNGETFFKPENEEEFNRLARIMHITPDELAEKLYGVHMANKKITRTDEDIKSALAKLAVDGTIKSIPKEYEWLRGQACARGITIRELVELFGYKYIGNKPFTRVLWSKEEDDFLIKNYDKKGAKWCSEHMRGRTVSSVMNRTKQLGIRHHKRYWTREEELFLIKNYKAHGPTWCSKHLDGRTVRACSQRADQLGVRRVNTRQSITHD